jgi:hypothetical protein
VTDYTVLFQMAASIALVAAPAILLSRLLAGSEGPSLTDLLAIPVDPPWPRGVQEEEPLPWRVERLHRRSSSTDEDQRRWRMLPGRPVGAATNSDPCRCS